MVCLCLVTPSDCHELSRVSVSVTDVELETESNYKERFESVFIKEVGTGQWKRICWGF